MKNDAQNKNNETGLETNKPIDIAQEKLIGGGVKGNESSGEIAENFIHNVDPLIAILVISGNKPVFQLQVE